ncbi:hypothetical protein JAAARDRAFT_338643 [Jaapia argillacea MUCL 33604]|uniref:Uncharacterized protein n=1 Tax=Jaapia argillacea MUCL 33604 TaxID=933084 RepID=A0A067PNX3_9AGAM|nr:hypothetical protein JAAARDRAFT_338643 [Jaapia argillacea MUCL 33604]
MMYYISHRQRINQETVIPSYSGTSLVATLDQPNVDRLDQRQASSSPNLIDISQAHDLPCPTPSSSCQSLFASGLRSDTPANSTKIGSSKLRPKSNSHAGAGTHAARVQGFHNDTVRLAKTIVTQQHLHSSQLEAPRVPGRPGMAYVDRNSKNHSK